MKNIVLITISMVLTQSLFAQKVFSIKSDKLERKVPVLVQKPANYQSSKSYPLVFMLHGYSENYEQWIKTTDLKKLATDYQMILVCPEGYVNYYLNSSNLKDFQYEDFFFQELVPKIEEKYDIDNKNIFITGLSMGGYGALSLFIKHSDFFNTAASTSGALEFDYENFKKVSLKFFESERMTKDMEMTLGNPKENDWKKFSISSLLENQKEFNKGFFIDCGRDDPLLSNTLQIKELALSKKLPIRFSIQPGEHNSEYWSKSVEYHFVYFKQHLKTE
ncbi:esterase [Polaribacter reichenbachii]|uniref:Esterase n=1 Tax=Polaribacter reichenbachii TaxID=996801 RepID=A0A1B8U2H8_9FLAO|nr:alpha/beta hydrolase-fold protein [Polaribacter reichenbachii]APZ48172.1 esterase [Polaribacter reichenbachii]AUC20441.1 esterase [Polaribacter reichenbachii]OBY66080.1 esterase [Polaribacter reichenbachii]